jgi:CubicO group peptidase (beta-lactamase class C family)
MTSNYLLLSFLLLFQSSVLWAQKEINGSKSTAFNKTVSKAVDKLMAQYNKPNSPGIAVSVIKDDAIVYEKGLGLANLEYDIPITNSSVFCVGSVAKQFTAFSILLLEQEGKLSLDDDIKKHLPEMADFGHKITLRHLANHTSGIRDNTDLANLVGTSEIDLISPAQVVKLITSQKGLNFIPGAEFEYSNSGYILLAEIVKRVSGQSYAQFTAERIFKPLKMSHTQFVDNPEIILKNRAYSYYKPDSIYYKSLLNHSFVGSTGLNTTAEDLSLWAMNFEKQTIGNAAIFNKMKERGKLNNGEILPYALGQELKEYKGLNVIFHGGGDAGYRAYLLRIPEHHFSVIVMGNDQSFNPLDIAYGIVDIYLKDKEAITPINTPNTPINPAILQNFVGDYEVFQCIVVSIIKEHDTLFLQAKGDDKKVKLPPINNYEFIYPNNPHSKIVFSRVNGQPINEFKWHFSDFVYKGQRIILEEFDENQVNLSELVGTYFNSEVNTAYNFEIKNNKLVATHNRNEDFNLSASQRDIFRSDRSYFGKIEIIRNAQHQVTGCYVLGQRLRRIKFEKMNK